MKSTSVISRPSASKRLTRSSPPHAAFSCTNHALSAPLSCCDCTATVYGLLMSFTATVALPTAVRSSVKLITDSFTLAYRT